jgi:putative lumazine-binding protein
MIKRLILFAMVSLAGRASAQAAPQGAEAEVLAVVNALFDGMRKVDSAMVRPLFHAKVRMITVDSRNPGARIEESVEGFIQSIGRPRTELFDEQLSNVRVMIDGSLASVWADYKFFRGTTLSHCGVDHFLLVKEGGKWQIIELSDTRRRENCA